MSSRNYVVTVATHTQGYLPSLQWCLNKTQGRRPQFIVLGRGQKWSNYFDKIRLLYEFLSSNNLGDNDVVIFCDAYDVIYDHRRDFDRLVEIFRRSQLDLLFSIVDISRQNKMIQKCAHKILACLDITNNTLTCNGGLYMGTRRALRAFMYQIYHNKSEQVDDERCINQLLNESMVSSWLSGSEFPSFDIMLGLAPYRVGLDVNSRLFYNSPVKLNPLNLVRSASAECNAIESRDAYFYHFIGNQNLDDLCAYEGIWRPECVGNCEIYGKMDKISHYLTFFNTELATLAIVFGLAATLLVSLRA